MPAVDIQQRVTRALRHRNYRLFFSGQSVSLVGTWITRVATSWLVYRLTGSVLLLGVVGFAGQIPTLVLAPFAGVLADRWDRHRIEWDGARERIVGDAKASAYLSRDYRRPWKL